MRYSHDGPTHRYEKSWFFGFSTCGLQHGDFCCSICAACEWLQSLRTRPARKPTGRQNNPHQNYGRSRGPSGSRGINAGPNRRWKDNSSSSICSSSCLLRIPRQSPGSHHGFQAHCWTPCPRFVRFGGEHQARRMPRRQTHRDQRRLLRVLLARG